jgi:hypothetical protein
VRVLVAIAVLSVFGMNSGHAEDWMFLRSDGHSEIYIDMSTIAFSGVIRRANFKRVNPTPKQPIHISWILYSIEREAFDCKDHRGRIDEMTFYVSDGTIEKEPVNAPVLWDPVANTDPDFELVCGWKASK